MDLSFKDLKVGIIVWVEMSRRDFEEKHVEKMKEAIAKGLLDERKGVELFKLEEKRAQARLYGYSEGLRLFCFVDSTERTWVNCEEAKNILRSLEILGLETIKAYFQQILGTDKPIWLYFYPVWYIGSTKPGYERLLEISPGYSTAIDKIVYLDPDELQRIYPLDVTTPEIASEVLPMTYEIYDAESGREAFYRVQRGVSFILGANENKLSWFAKVIPSRIEVRPYVSFGNTVPRKAEDVKSFPKFERIQLTSGKGWIDNMLVLEEALERQKIIGDFKEVGKGVKEDILLALAGVFAGISVQLLTFRADIFLAILTALFLVDACLMGYGIIIRDKMPRLSKHSKKVATYLFYASLVLFFLYAIAFGFSTSIKGS